MIAPRRLLPSLRAVVLIAGCGALCGCSLFPQTQSSALKAQNRSLSEQNRAQLAELANLKVHSRDVEEQLMRAEQDIARRDDQFKLNHDELANFQKERVELRKQFAGAIGARSAVPPQLSGQLADISRRYPSLEFDSQTGIAKLDTDILFDSGSDELKPGAEKLLGELAGVLKSPDGCETKILVAGHTDDRPIAKKPARDAFPNNFHLSTARALAVADKLRDLGVASERVGVAGFGQYQPVAPNLSPADRRKNRRVEIFVTAPDVPIVGWTETIPSVY